MVSRHVRNFLITSALAFGVASAVHAQPAGDAMHDHGGGHGAMGMHGHGGGPMRHLRALNLTEAQRDQIFKIHHEQQPAMREQMKQVRKARTELHQLALADKFDEARARQLADTQAKAMSAMTMMRVQSMRKVRDVLTPEQRQKLDQMREQRARG